jgi:hypothetical protein
LQSASTFQVGALLGRPNNDREAAEIGAFDFGDLADSKMIIKMMTETAMIPQGPRSQLCCIHTCQNLHSTCVLTAQHSTAQHSTAQHSTAQQHWIRKWYAGKDSSRLLNDNRSHSLQPSMHTAHITAHFSDGQHASTGTLLIVCRSTNNAADGLLQGVQAGIC